MHNFFRSDNDKDDDDDIENDSFTLKAKAAAVLCDKDDFPESSTENATSKQIYVDFGSKYTKNRTSFYEIQSLTVIFFFFLADVDEVEESTPTTETESTEKDDDDDNPETNDSSESESADPNSSNATGPAYFTCIISVFICLFLQT